jgi:hypothetical protein
MDNEKQQIEKCRQRIEEKIGWGSGSAWQNQDFEALSEAIFKETNVSLSVSTLKRLWGKIRYEGTPNITTLNALAQFLGYQSWRAFTANGFAASPVGTTATKSVSFSNVTKGIMAVAVAGAIVYLFLYFGNRPKKLTYENISFSSRSVAKTIPNTVVFNYNAKDSNADSVFIQQSWDPERRYKVDKNLTEFTSTYYFPGHFLAKLILDSSIVAEHAIYIESHGWLGTIHRQPIPVYATEDKILKEGIVSISNEFLAEQRIDLEKEKLSTSYFRVMKAEVIPDTAFQMDVTLKNTFAQGSAVCQRTEIALMGSMGFISIPLSIKGCVGELSLYADKFVDGKTNDLSAFGVDFTDWVTVRCRVQNKKISIWVNELPAFEGDYQKGMGEIVGSRISFMGTGAVKSFQLKKL